MDYGDLLTWTGLTVTASEVFGSYQGDSLYVVTDGSRTGAVVIGYGSCSGCDALQAAGGWSDWKTPAAERIEANTELQELAWGYRRGVRWGTPADLRAALTGEQGLLQWYAHEDGFSEAVAQCFSIEGELAAREITR